jgi:hypothetical protein
MVLVDVWRFWIPYDEPELYTTGKIIRWVSLWIGMLEIQGDKIDIVAIGEEENAPTDVSNYSLTISCSALGISYQGCPPASKIGP